jgi:cytosine/adenosine deaminase-related metal-dependent hydrolase
VVRVGKDPWPSQYRPYPGQVTVIRGATIYDGAGRRIDNGMIRLEVGKRADIVLWDGDPLELMSSPVAVWIDVAAQPMTSRQTLLAQRYKALGRTDLPLQYPQ